MFVVENPSSGVLENSPRMKIVVLGIPDVGDPVQEFLMFFFCRRGNVSLGREMKYHAPARLIASSDEFCEIVPSFSDMSLSFWFTST